MGRAMKKLWSVFTDDMDTCFYTGSPYIERHHIFGGSNRQRSEEYGFVIPLRYDLHPNGANASQAGKLLDSELKQMAQKYYEENIGTREEFTSEFGKNYL